MYDLTSNFQTWRHSWEVIPPLRTPKRGENADEAVPDSTRGAVIMDLGPLSLIVGVLLSIIGFSVHYLRAPQDSPGLTEKAARRHIHPIDLEHANELGPGAIAFGEPGANAARVALEESPHRILERLSTLFAAPDLIRPALLAEFTSQCASDLDDLGSIAMWLQLKSYRSTLFLPSSRWACRVLNQPNTHSLGILIHRADQVAKSTAKVISTFLRHGDTGLNSDFSQSQSEIESIRSHALTDFDKAAKVLFVPHKGLGYGSLFRWDHLFSPDSTSPLHPSRMIALSYDENTIEDFMPSAKLVWDSKFLRALRLAKVLGHGLLAIRRFADFRTLWTLARTCESALGLAMNIRRRFPSATTAILAYEMLVPRVLSLALIEAGIQTIATQERPAATFQQGTPKIVQTLLTASPYFSEAILDSPVACVESAIPIGMWRTDLLHEYRLRKAPDVIQEALSNGLKIVVALPYHIEATVFASRRSMQLSWTASRIFLQDIIYLSKQHEEVMFIVRGKNAEWWKNVDFADEVAELKSRFNAWVDLDFSELNRSYKLCAHADLVIARHTSLAEECLALDIPTIFHDYSHNMDSMFFALFPYLPPSLWAHSREELAKKSELVLSQRGTFFREWWLPFRSEYFGNLCDGHVRERARTLIEKVV